MGGRNLGLMGLPIAFCAGTALGIHPAASAAGEFESFLAAHADGQSALKLERDMAGAITRNDRTWFDREARGPARLAARVQAEARRRGPQATVQVGPCHLAWLSLEAVVARTVGTLRPARRSGPIGSAVPQDVANLAAEQLDRCELVKRLPRSSRLIGSVAASGR